MTAPDLLTPRPLGPARGPPTPRRRSPRAWTALSIEAQSQVAGGRHGRHFGCLYAVARSRSSAGLPRRDLKATRRRDTAAHPDEAQTPRSFRLRIWAQRHRQPVHALRAARGMALRQGDRPPCRRELRQRPQGSSRRPLRRRQDHCPSITISASTARLHSMRPFPPTEPDASSSASNGTVSQSTEAGST